MALTPGTRLGHYEVLSAIGAGGMGEVYRAHDARLKRDVAIKSLPPEVAQDPERTARFRREAEALAAFAVSADGQRFLINSLTAERLRRRSRWF